jgi:putative transposase
MPRQSSKKIIKHVSIDELNEIIKAEKNNKIKEKLKFIKLLYDGLSVPKASEKIKETPPTCYKWLKQWNTHGYDGLKMKKGSGRQSKLNEDEQKEIKKIIHNRLYDCIADKKEFYVSDLIKIINDEYGVDYSEKRIKKKKKKWGYAFKLNKIYFPD